MSEFLALVAEAAKTTSWQEWCAVGFSALYVVLAARQSLWCWPAAMVGTAVSIWLFASGGLVYESLLNVFYFVMAVVGLVAWIRGRTANSDMPVTNWPLRKHLYWIGGLLASVPLLGYTMIHLLEANNAYLDAFTTVFSVLATFMLIRKVIENWLYWIVIDLASIWLYLQRGYELYALLALVYTGMAVYGYFQWRKTMNNAEATAPA